MRQAHEGFAKLSSMEKDLRQRKTDSPADLVEARLVGAEFPQTDASIDADPYGYESEEQKSINQRMSSDVPVNLPGGTHVLPMFERVCEVWWGIGDGQATSWKLTPATTRGRKRVGPLYWQRIG